MTPRGEALGGDVRRWRNMRRALPPIRRTTTWRLGLALLLAGTTLLGSARTTSVAGEDGWQPYAGLLPNQGPGYNLLLVRDAVTGRPVAGAQVEARWEEAYENGAWAPLQSRGTTDDHGVFWQPHTEESGARHWEVRASGYAPAHEYTTEALDEEVLLESAVPQHGRIVDAAGRPVAGVTVAWKVGCAHAPFHGSALTDANGHFLLPDCPDNPDIGTVAGPGIAFDPYNVSVAPVWAVAPLTVAAPGVEVVGRLPPSQGPWPLTLAARQQERGPLLAVPPDGAFRLANVDPDTTLEVWDFVPPGSPPGLPRPFRSQPLALDLEDWTPGAPVLFDTASSPPDEPACRVLVRLVGARAEDEEPLKLCFDRMDGRRFTRWIEPPTQSDDEPLEVPAGAYVVRLETPFARYHAEALHFVADARETATLVLPVRPCDRILLPYGNVGLARELGIRPEELADCLLYVAAREPLSGAWRLKVSTLSPEDQEGPLALVPGCEVALWAHGPCGTIRFQPLEAQDGVRAVSWTVEPGGALDILGMVAEKTPAPSLEVSTPMSVDPIEGGRRLRVAQPGRYVLSEDSVRTVVQIPPYVHGRDPARLESSALRPTPTNSQRLDIRLPAGLPPLDDLEFTRIQIVRLDGPDAGTRWLRLEGWEDDVTRGDGAVTLRDALLAPGATVRAPIAMSWVEDAEGVAQHPGFDLAPQVIHLEGEGPWTHEFPARGLDLRVRLSASSEVAKPLPFLESEVLVLLAGQIYAVQPQPDGSGLLRVRGLPAGPLLIAVTAQGHEGRQRTLAQLGDGVSALEVDLPLRR